MLATTPRYAIESFDRRALMLSEREYIAVASLKNCSATLPLSVSLIPKAVGVLTDVNLIKKIYISLDFVNVRPFLYVATVARLGSSTNLVSLRGANVAGRKISQLKKYAFGGTGDAGSSAISPDGRFVAPSGELDCSADAYPGVWEIEKNIRVVADDLACAHLFDENQ
ncbi:hypothetical protein [Burkholderia sp. Leaf177]|uniref:hypothetical protein n=1 Tax=Burkholderia sp. Leaf177 TaxID=1736287 RepID=UPI001F2645F6|nr:hypothetical protein [Burkholderia sp. Leaf177]